MQLITKQTTISRHKIYWQAKGYSLRLIGYAYLIRAV